MGGTSSHRDVERLIQLIGPPKSRAAEIDWLQTLREYGHGFPDDYVEFMGIYGEGIFNNFLTVAAPISEMYPEDPLSRVSGLTEEARFTGEEEGFEDFSLLVGWGITVDSDLLCWYADSDDPNEWGTIIWRRQWGAPESWIKFNCGMVSLICDYAAQRIPNFFDTTLPYVGSRFVNSRDERRFRRAKINPWGSDPAV